MSSKSSRHALHQFVDKVKSSDIVGKQHELNGIITGPLAVAREKIEVLETDEAIGILSRVESNYIEDLKKNVEGIFYEELERGTLLLEEIDSTLTELQAFQDSIGQRLFSEKQKKQILSISLNLYEDSKHVLTFLKLRSVEAIFLSNKDKDMVSCARRNLKDEWTNVLRLQLNVPLTEKPSTVDHDLDFEIEEGNYLLRLILAKFVQLQAINMQRVTVYENGCSSEGRIIPILPSMKEFLQRIQKEFECPDYKIIYTASGALVSDVNLIRNDEILYASKGELFCPLTTTNGKAEVTDTCSDMCVFKRRNSSDWVKLNVGGQLFYTSRTTLLNSDPESMLARMFAPNSNLHPSCIDSNGAYLIDRDPKYFSPLLNYLRSGALILDPDINPRGVLEEAYFFNIQSCIPLLEPLTVSRDEAPLSRRDIINALIVTPNKDSLRFQGVNLTGADLSYLDLRNINFKYAKLRNVKLSYCNLSFCNFERADMTDVVMNCAVLSGVRLNGAIMENARCLNCNFQDPSGGHNANMEGVNLRNSVLEDSDLTGANLRVANLKGANLKATILRGAILAGADLEKSDLTGSDLHEANLRGANLKDAALELMINPLHMSQAIR